MKHYKSHQLINITAVQFTGKKEDIPQDLLSIATIYRNINSSVSDKDGHSQSIAYFEFKLGNFPVKALPGDWIVKQQDNHYNIVSHSLFNLLFSPL